MSCSYRTHARRNQVEKSKETAWLRIAHAVCLLFVAAPWQSRQYRLAHLVDQRRLHREIDHFPPQAERLLLRGGETRLER
eukprot:6482883-Prymnesium_polylepis.1